MDRCVPAAMAGDPSLTHSQAQVRCSVTFEENQVPGQPVGLHSLPPAEPMTAQMDAWRADAEARAAAQRAEKIARREEERQDRIERTRQYYQDELTDQLETRLAELVNVERGYLSELLSGVVKEVTKGVVDDLEQLRSELMDRMDQLEARVEGLESDMDTLKAYDKAKVIDLPNVLQKRGGT
jgi:hypothetical protein